MTRQIVNQETAKASRARLVADRRRRGHEIARTGRVREYRYGWLVESQSEAGKAYYVTYEYLSQSKVLYRCDCDDWRRRCGELGISCKHGEAVEHRHQMIRRGEWCPFHDRPISEEHAESAAFAARRFGLERWHNCLACTLEAVERLLALDPSMMTLESEVA